MPLKQEYVLGFAFDPLKKYVVLIQKNRPAEQAGKWNGLGGKIESGEGIFKAMEREFEEESGVLIPAYMWNTVAVMEGENWRVFVLTALSYDVFDVTTKEDEIVRVFELNHWDIYHPRFLPNLAWLIPMCLTRDFSAATIEY